MKKLLVLAITAGSLTVILGFKMSTQLQYPKPGVFILPKNDSQTIVMRATSCVGVQKYRISVDEGAAGPVQIRVGGDGHVEHYEVVASVHQGASLDIESGLNYEIVVRATDTQGTSGHFEVVPKTP